MHYIYTCNLKHLRVFKFENGGEVVKENQASAMGVDGI